jgi:hypothetical protein
VRDDPEFDPGQMSEPQFATKLKRGCREIAMEHAGGYGSGYSYPSSGYGYGYGTGYSYPAYGYGNGIVGRGRNTSARARPRRRLSPKAKQTIVRGPAIVPVPLSFWAGASLSQF